MSRHVTIFLIFLACSACSPIDNPVDSEIQASYLDRTTPFGFQIGIPTSLAEVGWLVKNPQFLVGTVVDGFQQLQIDRVFGLQVL